jgi:hypothetical protein
MMHWQGFRWENDTWWWERVRLDEVGFPASWNFVVPDKLMHFLSVFLLAWLLSRWLPRTWAVLIAWAFMMGPWELLWDGCFRYGASWKDMVANTLGAVVCWWWLSNPTIGQE